MRNARGISGMAFVWLLVGCGNTGTQPVTEPEPVALFLAFAEPGFDTVATIDQVGTDVGIVYSGDGPLNTAKTSLFADIDGDLTTRDDQIMIAVDRPASAGAPQRVTWRTLGAPPGRYQIVARVEADGAAPLVGAAPGTVRVVAPFTRRDGLLTAQTGRGVVAAPDGATYALGWAARFEPTTSYVYGTGDPRETVFVTEAFNGKPATPLGPSALDQQNPYPDLHLARYDADGSLAWAQALGGATYRGGSVQTRLICSAVVSRRSPTALSW